MEEKFVEIDGNKIRYLESGSSKKTLVLVHGLGASSERWQYVLPFFESNFHVIVPDLIGFGYSDKPIADYTIDYFSNFLKKFLISLGVEQTSIIGSSLGGQIAAEYTSSNSQHVDKLILVSPSGIMKQSTFALDAYIMAALYPNQQSAKNAFETMDGSGKKIPMTIIDGFVTRMKLPNAKLSPGEALSTPSIIWSVRTGEVLLNPRVLTTLNPRLAEVKSTPFIWLNPS
mgnify:CR=1 FL=1